MLDLISKSKIKDNWLILACSVIGMLQYYLTGLFGFGDDLTKLLYFSFPRIQLIALSFALMQKAACRHIAMSYAVLCVFVLIADVSQHTYSTDVVLFGHIVFWVFFLFKIEDSE